MNKLEQAAWLALDVLENERCHVSANWDNVVKAITALREALKPTREGKYYYKDNRWRVHLRCNGKRISIGSFVELNDAVEAARRARQKYHGEFAHGTI